MADLTPFALSKMLTQLAGRNVSFAITADLPGDANALYAEYVTKPGDGPLVLKADVALIASLGGALLGLPQETVLERSKQTPLDESLRDAIHEVLNVVSTPLSFNQRSVFQNFSNERIYLSDSARTLLDTAPRIDRFQAAVEGYASGMFAVYSDV